MLKLGIIGYPLGHSLSPVMHNAALKHLNINGEYNLLETAPEDFIDRIKELKVSKFKGFNITIPHKVAIIPFLEHVDKFANVVGAVNTVKILEDNTLCGYNTDVYGFVNAFSQDQKEQLKGKNAAVFGTGGAARAIAIGLADMGIKEIVFYARNIVKAAEFIISIKAKCPNVNVRLFELNDNVDLNPYSLLVNTTPLGMEGRYEGFSPVSEASIATLPKDAIVYDIVYKPRITKLLQYSLNNNLTIIEGIEMLVFQGAKAFEIWTGQKAPVDIMREAAINKL